MTTFVEDSQDLNNKRQFVCAGGPIRIEARRFERRADDFAQGDGVAARGL